jgi:hypothetical protein
LGKKMKPVALIIASLVVGSAASAVRAAPDSPAQAANPVVGYLQFFHRWDTPADDHAAELFGRVVKPAPTFAEFQRLVPIGTESRALFERHLAAFEEAAGLIRSGKMSEDLFFDAWYAMPGSWTRAKPYVLGMRKESGNPALYQGFEWLASRAEAFWTAREKNPPQWHPLTQKAPTADDEAIYQSFFLIWATPRDAIGRDFVAALEKRAPSAEEFLALVPPGSEEYTKFDRIMCAYDQAGALIKNGILHPALFFRTWRSPTDLWKSAGPWIQALRVARRSEHLYDNIDWLVGFERQWRIDEKKEPNQTAEPTAPSGRGSS